ncbi:YesL family protein, partial [Romboutsia sp.]|uniref:YesL family protein n=1 Tax=Romboutsia sp. TaxID=1965302 RepID=UPI003F3E97FB
MDNLFRYDNNFFETLRRTTDIVILNFLFIFSCIPIITIGASVTATYSVAMKIVKDEDNYIAREFIKKFKENFKVSTMIWTFMLIVGGVLILDFNISNMISNQVISKILLFIFTLVSIIFIFILTYIFPIISKFDNTIKNTIINSILISIQNLPYTIIMVLLNLSPIVLLYLLSSFWGH